MRVLANLLSLPGFDFESTQDVLKKISGANEPQVPANRLSNASQGEIVLSGVAGSVPAVASIYQLDGLVRRATSLQLTNDARQAAPFEGTGA